MEIENLTLKQIREITALVGGGATRASAPVEIGKAYLFRTVTHIEVGRVVKVVGDFIELEDASWIADTGRYHDCLKKGTFSEVEPYPLTTTINAASLINYAPWPHALPKEQK